MILRSSLKLGAFHAVRGFGFRHPPQAGGPNSLPARKRVFQTREKTISSPARSLGS